MNALFLIAYELGPNQKLISKDVNSQKLCNQLNICVMKKIRIT